MILQLVDLDPCARGNQTISCVDYRCRSSIGLVPNHVSYYLISVLVTPGLVGSFPEAFHFTCSNLISHVVIFLSVPLFMVQVCDW